MARRTFGWNTQSGKVPAREYPQGYTRDWEIEPARLDEARRWLDHIEGQWDEALSRLKASLERET